MNRFLIINDELKVFSPKKSRRQRLTTAKSAAAAPDWCQIEYNIIRTALEEEEDVWTKPDGTKRREDEPEMLKELEKYWRDGVQVSDWKAKAQRSTLAKNSEYWSAAFVCWVLRNAGVERSHGFRFGIRHMNYIVEAMRNREGESKGMAQYKDKAFWLYDINEQDTVKIEPGDILCMNRKSNGKLTNWTYAGLKKKFFDGGKHTETKTYGSSHCDVVVDWRDHQKDGQTKYLLGAIGGNKRIPPGGRGLTVNRIEIETDAAGKILNPAANRIFAYIKFRKCPQESNL